MSTESLHSVSNQRGFVMIKKSELLKEIKDIFSKLPECTDEYLKALDYAAFLAEQDEDNNVLLVDKDYWFKYYDIIQSEWKDKDGNYYGDSIRIVKEADPEAKEAEMIENYNSESQDIEPDNMAGIGGLLGGLMGGLMGGVFPPPPEDIIDAEYTETMDDIVEPETESSEE